MKTVGTLEAKTRFSALLHAVERGEEILVTRHGKPVARLSPADFASVRPSQGSQFLLRARELRGSLRLSPGETIKGLVNAGRKH